MSTLAWDGYHGREDDERHKNHNNVTVILNPRPCDRCGLPVPSTNDAVLLDITLGHGDPLSMLLGRPRHLLPTRYCEGSPSRAQYLEGQPRDPRPEYAYNADHEAAISEAHERMIEWAESYEERFR